MKNQIKRTKALPRLGRFGPIMAGVLLMAIAAPSAPAQVLPSSSLPYGLSYGDWSAKWWQWSLGQSTNQMDSVSGPIAGPVRFLQGAPDGSVTETLNVTIADGTALFFPILSAYDDNSACPLSSWTSNTVEQLQAATAGNWSAVTETTCTIDGVAVGGLDDPQTTSYRAQATPFNYTTAETNSILQSAFGEPCIPGGTTVGPAVADGVYLMLAPLAAGSHTIQLIGIVGPASAPYVAVNLTYLVTVLAPPPADARILPPAATPYGKTYSDWSAAWWQWSLSQSTNQMDSVSGPIAGPVRFLAGAPGSVTATNDVTLPSGTALFFPILSTWDDNSSCPLSTWTSNTVDQLQAAAAGNWSITTETTCTIDGVAVAGLDDPQTTGYRAQATPFTYITAQTNSVIQSLYGDPCVPGGTIMGPVAADGAYLMLAPLAAGNHTIHFVGIVGPTTSPYVDVDLTYQVTVLPAPPADARVLAPDATPYGKTYSDWSAAWWQWSLSQSTNSIELVSGPMAGPVRFLGGGFNGSVTATNTVTVPDGTALFFPILSAEADNSSCPLSTWSSNTVDQLQAEAAGNWSAASETTCAIDGVAVDGLDNPQTSGYRVQATPFNYTTAQTNGVVQIYYGDACVPGGTTIGPTVADGVYLMLAPLSAGNHTIHWVGIVGPTSAPYVDIDLTYQVTVQPVALSIAAQGATLVLSWPQTGTSYVVESASSLSSPKWSPVSAAIQSVNGNFQISIANSVGSQFFRLHEQ